MPLQTGYWFCASDTSGNRLVGRELQFSPAPAELELPRDFLGSLQETADGNAISQSPGKDPRTRAWVWRNFPEWMPAYQKLWQQLLALHARSRYRSGQSPYVYLYDSSSGKFTRRVDLPYGVSAVGSNTVTTSSTLTSDTITGGLVEVVSGTGAGQQGHILSKSGNQITVSPAWPVALDTTSKIVVHYQVPDWFRVRVIHVERSPAPDKATMYSDTRIVFVVDDFAWTDF